MENGRCIDDLPLHIGIFRSRVSLPEAKSLNPWEIAIDAKEFFVNFGNMHTTTTQ